MIFTRSNRCLSLLTRTHYPINQIRTQRLFTTDNIKPDVQSKDETEASESISPLEEKEREIAQLKVKLTNLFYSNLTILNSFDISPSHLYQYQSILIP